jgi:hypothetical protein
MHFAEGGEPLAVMTPEVTKVGVVGVEPQGLAYDLDGENLCIRKFGQGPRALWALSSIRSRMRQKKPDTKLRRDTIPVWRILSKWYCVALRFRVKCVNSKSWVVVVGMRIRALR